MSRSAGLALLALLAAGCGHTLAVRSTLRPPAPGAPARNIADVLFLTPRLGFLASSKGQFDREPARIQRTTDGGRTWRDVWTGPRTYLDWIAFADARHGFVGGDHFVLRSSDRGRTWTRAPMVVPKRVRDWALLEPHFVSPSRGFAVTDPASFAQSGFLRTADGGSHWVAVRGLQSVYGVDFVTSRTGFAIGNGLYRTNDSGATWQRLRLPRVKYVLAAVDFLDARRGFVAGGNPAVLELGPSQAVWATANGGRTWQRRFVNPRRGYSAGGGYPFVRLHFVDVRRGWATTGLCKCCPSGPCAGDVYTTRDGGYTWRRRWTEVQLTTVGARDAWALPRCDIECDVLWHTGDGGETWRPVARPDRIDLASVHARGRRLVLDSFDGARFLSRDGGRTWTLARTPAQLPELVRRVRSPRWWRRPAAPIVSLAPAGGGEAWAVLEPRRRDGDRHRLWHTTDGGKTWTEVWPALPTRG